MADIQAMKTIEIRVQQGVQSPDDLTVAVQDTTFDYLMSSPSPEIRVSTYLDRDWPKVEANYAEIFVQEGCLFESKVVRVIPGSKTRKNLVLPCPMLQGEQLIVIVTRKQL